MCDMCSKEPHLRTACGRCASKRLLCYCRLFSSKRTQSRNYHILFNMLLRISVCRTGLLSFGTHVCGSRQSSCDRSSSERRQDGSVARPHSKDPPFRQSRRALSPPRQLRRRRQFRRRRRRPVASRPAATDLRHVDHRAAAAARQLDDDRAARRQRGRPQSAAVVEAVSGAVAASRDVHRASVDVAHDDDVTE